MFSRVAAIRCRVIPACAGNTIKGERGGQLRRVIPACAGNTGRWFVTTQGGSGHPRMRGEHADLPIPKPFAAGSSPHARGTRRLHRRDRRGRRVIPACAGNTGEQAGSRRVRSGHPRMRGEHLRDLARAPEQRGSSPHARGTRVIGRSAGTAGRVIPACAGNTGNLPQIATAASGHPRMRGEHFSRSAVCRASIGSSPHARGTRRPAVRRRLPHRVIPACAGNTLNAAITDAPRPGHPRMRGEHETWAERGEAPDGSSPHARGTPMEDLA